jgi:hypothetical protein
MFAEPLKFDHDPHASAEHTLITMGPHPVGGKVYGTLFIRDLPSSNPPDGPGAQKPPLNSLSGFVRGSTATGS